MSKINNLLSNIKSISLAVFIALLIRSFIAEPFNIPSGSMKPNLLVGDFIFVSKWSYGYSKHSLPFSIPLLPKKIFEKIPERGDVVVFKTPQDNKDFVDIDKHGNKKRIRQYEEFFFEKEVAVIDIMDNGMVDNTPLYTVPAGHFFVMGDNRDNSQDSRFINVVGYVPMENLVGKAQFIFFSLENSRFLQIWKWPKAIRYGRLFKSIQ